MNNDFEAIFYEYDALPSTQIEAKRLAALGIKRAIVVAREQTHGRGRHARKWESNAGGLYVSFLVCSGIHPSMLHAATIIPALAVHGVLNGLGLCAILKWPNDVLVEIDNYEKKICGILCESAIENESVKYCVIGVGVNCELNSIPDELRHRACAIDEFIERVDRKKILFEIAEKIFLRFDNFNSQKIMEEYRANCATLGRDVRIETGDNVILGRATQIDDSGELVVETEKSGVKKFNAADVFHATIQRISPL